MVLFNHDNAGKQFFAPRYFYALSFHVCPECILLFLTTGVSLRNNKENQEGRNKLYFKLLLGDQQIVFGLKLLILDLLATHGYTGMRQQVNETVATNAYNQAITFCHKLSYFKHNVEIHQVSRLVFDCTFSRTKKHNVHRLTLNLHSLKIMMVEKLP